MSCQVQHIADVPYYEFFPSDIIPGDSGTFIATGGVLYAPDFENHDGAVSALFYLGDYTPFNPLSPTGRDGAGTAS